MTVSFPIVAPEEGDLVDPDWAADITEAVNNHEDRIDAAEAAVLAWGSRTTGSSTTTGETGVLRLDDKPVTGGVMHSIVTSVLYPASSVAGDTVGCQVHYTTDGSTPTTSSTLLPGSLARVTIPASGVTSCTINAFYVPAVNQTLSLLLSVSRISGTGNASINGGSQMDMVLTALGTSPGDTGTDV